MRIALVAGLVLRHGQRQLELTRELGDGSYILEDILTKRPQELSGPVLLSRIWDGTYEPVSEGALPGAGDLAASSAMSMASLPEKAANEVERRLKYVKAVKAAHLRRGQKAGVCRVIRRLANELGEKPPSFSTVYRWAAAFDAAGPRGLVTKNVGRKRARLLVEAQLACIHISLRNIYFTRARHSLELAFADVQRRNKALKEAGTIPQSAPEISIATLRREVNKVDKFHRIAAREGREAALRACRTAMNVDHPVAPLQRVEVDHTPLNWVVICDRTGLPLGRPMLTVAIDAFSGYVLGMYVSFHGASVTSVTGVIRSSISIKTDQLLGFPSVTKPWLASGLFTMLVLDNGMEFHSDAFRRIAWTLETDLMYCKVRTPWLKPHVERFFASLDWLSLAKGRVRKEPLARDALDPMQDAAISFSAFVEGLLMFIIDVHPFEVNERSLARPFDTFGEGLTRLPPVQYPGSLQDFKLASAISTTRSVGPGGVQCFGMPYGSAELLPLQRALGNNFRANLKWDPDDISRIFLQSPKDETWLELPCRWTEYSAGLSSTQHKAIRDHRRKELKSKDSEEELMRARLRLLDHWSIHGRKMTRKDAKTFACASGFTSARLMEPALVEPPRPSLLIEAPKVLQVQVPEFDTFILK